jgi:ABC-2 type transport system ATP-binding protein
LIREVGKEKTVMLSTHIMQEVSAICDRVIIINSGKIVADGKESSIVATDNNSGLALFVEFSEPQDMNALKLVEGVDEISQINSSSYMISSQKDIREGIFRFAVANNQVILTMKQQERNMEDAFRYWTNSNK